jgi:hypothetical protein
VITKSISSIFDSEAFQNLISSLQLNSAEQEPLVVDLYKNPFRQKEHEHIQAILDHLPDRSYKREIGQRLISPNAASHLDAWHELMVYDWLSGLGKELTLQPKIPGSKPEFYLESNGLPLFIEVAVVQESRKDIGAGTNFGSVRFWWPEATESFKTMMGRLINKMGQHRGIISAAYVICLCLESHLIDIGEVKTAFLGGESVDVVSGEVRSTLDGLIFENQGDMQLFVKYKNVSALLVARHSGVSPQEGYKLTFGLIQNPYANIPIPQTEFGPLRRFVVVSETEGHFFMKWL